MPIKYFQAPDIQKIAEEMIEILDWKHIPLEHVGFVRSSGSKARGTIARCHGLGKAMQIGMKRTRGFYLVEVISERFDKLSKQDQLRTIIHELMHIPKTFGGGFAHHHIVNDRAVERTYKMYCNLKEKKIQWL